VIRAMTAYMASIVAARRLAQAESESKRPVHRYLVASGRHLHSEGCLAICKLHSNAQFGPDLLVHFGVYSWPGQKNQSFDPHILVE
jgi:hypothetical protein